MGTWWPDKLLAMSTCPSSCVHQVAPSTFVFRIACTGAMLPPTTGLLHCSPQHRRRQAPGGSRQTPRSVAAPLLHRGRCDLSRLEYDHCIGLQILATGGTNARTDTNDHSQTVIPLVYFDSIPNKLVSIWIVVAEATNAIFWTVLLYYYYYPLL